MPRYVPRATAVPLWTGEAISPIPKIAHPICVLQAAGGTPCACMHRQLARLAHCALGRMPCGACMQLIAYGTGPGLSPPAGHDRLLSLQPVNASVLPCSPLMPRCMGTQAGHARQSGGLQPPIAGLVNAAHARAQILYEQRCVLSPSTCACFIGTDPLFVSMFVRKLIILVQLIRIRGRIRGCSCLLAGKEYLFNLDN